MVESWSDPTAFAVGTGVLVWLSRKALARPGSHGFYRFFSWEAILALVVLNRQIWGEQPFTPHQMTSWILMLTSIGLAITGVLTLKSLGKPGEQRNDGSFYEFEKTTQLVSSGIFGYIRHPMYTSLLALTWGAFFQDPSWLGACIAAAGTICLQMTAMTDEKECLAYFGEPYAEYMRRTRRFVPYLF